LSQPGDKTVGKTLVKRDGTTSKKTQGVTRWKIKAI